MHWPKINKRKICVGFTIIAAAIVGALIYFYTQFSPTKNPGFGVTFSQLRAMDLGLDWKKTYDVILSELDPKYIRLMSYWELLEGERGIYKFEDLDHQVREAEKSGAKVILVVGRKQPRWPECHEPGWSKELPGPDRERAELEFVSQVVKRYRENAAIEMWQVENEPRFRFGPECDKTPLSFLEKEIDLVKSLDNRPVMVTDSGELGLWLPSTWRGADYFGSTMYRTVHDKRFGYITYPLPPLHFRLKAGMLKSFTSAKDVLGVELQAEPWFISDAQSTPLEEHQKLMNAEIFAKNVAYAKATGFARHYLWGVEYWYWVKEAKGDGQLWEAAKELFKNN